MSLYGYDKNTKYPLDNTYRSRVVGMLKNKSNLFRKEEKNLFGMTAFYRLGTRDK
jgi:hypothetical protein